MWVKEKLDVHEIFYGKKFIKPKLVTTYVETMFQQYEVLEIVV